LYPKGEKPSVVTTEKPVLTLPLRVGLAFVPSNNYSDGLSQTSQIQLLDKVKAAFSKEKYINEIVIIPDVYLKGGKGFETLDQVARLHGTDIMALVSYDQVSNLTDTKASLLYWTIAGAYVIKGNKNDIQTFVDTAVFDMKTRKLLFRAPGINNISGTTTLVEAEDKIRKNKEKSFNAAVDDMNINLNNELIRFKERIKTEKVADVRHYSSGGGGSTSWYLLLVIGSLLLARTKNLQRLKIG
jgi:rhombotail lipoprotein